MSTHPNVILMVALTPDDLSRKTMRSILEANGIKEDDFDDDVKISGKDYHHEIMESDYDESWQISAKEGDLIFFDLVTYGYGDTIKWSDLETQKNELEAWAKEICEKFSCSYEIIITANYW